MAAIQPHRRTPEYEHPHLREPAVGWEPKGTCGFIRYLEHGFPSPLVRWHYHEEYELHLIVSTSGKVFVGDYIGHFGPGQLVLTGPRLPHNWISTEVPGDGVELRDVVIQFSHEPLQMAAGVIPELREIMMLLERSRFGVEFKGVSGPARALLGRIRDSQGSVRLSAFIELMCMLAHAPDYQLLSSAQMRSFEDDAALAKINTVIAYIIENSSRQFSMAELSAQAGMTESRFSRFFKRATGNTFTEFVNRLRINRACQLLMETDRYITNVCYDVGFNNVANFNRRFLQIKGMTPKEFRRLSGDRFGRPA